MSRLVDPKTIISIKNLPLAAKTTVDGFMAGIHNSNVKGVGMEFSQYRSYQAGDDLRRLDWRMFARSDRYYIRESEIETSISVRLLIDASASMNHEDSGITKIEYARYLAASLAYLASLQGDAVGLYVFQNNNLFSLPSRKDPRHLSRIFHQLEQIHPSDTFTEPVYYKSIFNSSGKKELLIFITDYYERHGEITKLLQSLAINKHEIIVFHLIGKNEVKLDFTGYTTLEDLETGETIKVDSVKSSSQYKERLDAYLASIKNELLSRNIFYELITMNEPIDKALPHFLNRRNKLRG
jgi:uncharacterized protein (DUF58 family)